MRNTGETKVAVFELDKVDFRHAQNLGTDLRAFGPGKSVPLCIVLIRMFVQPPSAFIEKTGQPWLEAYQGPCRSDVDATSLEGKVVCGYQGWSFSPRAPGDSDRRWLGALEQRFRADPPETLSFEMWPDMAGYKKKYPADQFKYADGTQAYLFSSADPETIDLHFDWMRDYGIDGVFVQQFLVSLDRPDAEDPRLGTPGRKPHGAGFRPGVRHEHIPAGEGAACDANLLAPTRG